MTWQERQRAAFEMWQSIEHWDGCEDSHTAGWRDATEAVVDELDALLTNEDIDMTTLANGDLPALADRLRAALADTEEVVA